MSFQTGLSGLNASSKSLDVIGNNIANANTVGFKSSRNEFAELVSASLSGGNGGGGIGAASATISQQFTQGNINITGNSMDVAINGGGFFQVGKTDGTSAYTRDGQFKLDKDGNIVTNTGSNLLGFTTDLNGVPTSITPQKLSIPTGAPIPASQTKAITAEFNLDARAKVADSVTPPTAVGTYGTSVTTFDSQGVAQPFSMYFVKIDPANAGYTHGRPLEQTPPLPAKFAADPTLNQTYDQWAIYATSSPTATDAPIGYMAFDSTGALAATYTSDAAGLPTESTTFGQLPVTITPASPSIVPAYTPTLDLTKATEYGTAFNVSNLTQDGYTAGDLTGVTIEASGVVTTRYSNGQTQAHGQIALADFRNLQGLKPQGGGEYLETYFSGQPIQGSPGVGKFGELRAGAVEESNVDLTAELVSMMTAQRNYQASAQTIKTQDQVMQTLTNLR